MNVNKHTESLFPFIFYAPKEEQRKYANGYDYFSDEWLTQNSEDCIFRGILFRNNRVFTLNIEIFCKENDYEPQYLEITDTFNELLKTYNIYDLCILLSTVLKKKYYKESSLAHKLRLRIKYDKPSHLPKFRYAIEKHHSRHRKFYFDTKDCSRGLWDSLLYSALHEISSLESFAKASGRHRPNLFTYNQSEPIFHTTQNSVEYAEPLQRKPRRWSLAFKP